jgi:hypothetical protein
MRAPMSQPCEGIGARSCSRHSYAAHVTAGIAAKERRIPPPDVAPAHVPLPLALPEIPRAEADRDAVAFGLCRIGVSPVAVRLGRYRVRCRNAPDSVPDAQKAPEAKRLLGLSDAGAGNETRTRDLLFTSHSL